jgi:RNA polymerase sigma-70 factor (ECF subfamily)
MIQNEEASKDAVQEVWLELVKNLQYFRNESKVSTWLYTITCRVVMRLTKKERQYTTRYLSNYFRGEDLGIPDYENFDKQLWVKEMCDKCLTGILHCLDNEARLAYILRDISMLTYQEISEILEKEESTVRKMISRSRSKLRNFLNDECILSNPESKCKCRMSKWVMEVSLPEEYRKLKEITNKINLYKASETILPEKNFWLNKI